MANGHPSGMVNTNPDGRNVFAERYFNAQWSYSISPPGFSPIRPLIWSRKRWTTFRRSHIFSVGSSYPKGMISGPVRIFYPEDSVERKGSWISGPFLCFCFCPCTIWIDFLPFFFFSLLLPFHFLLLLFHPFFFLPSFFLIYI